MWHTQVAAQCVCFSFSAILRSRRCTTTCRTLRCSSTRRRTRRGSLPQMGPTASPRDSLPGALPKTSTSFSRWVQADRKQFIGIKEALHPITDRQVLSFRSLQLLGRPYVVRLFVVCVGPTERPQRTRSGGVHGEEGKRKHGRNVTKVDRLVSKPPRYKAAAKYRFCCRAKERSTKHRFIPSCMLPSAVTTGMSEA